MEIEQPRHLEYTPFPRNSVNLIVGPTHIGKTYFVTKLLSNYKKYFTSPINRILIILCNERVLPLTFPPELDVPVEQIPLKEYDSEDLQENDLVVIDDLQSITHHIRLTITVCAHHYNLVSLFVVTHNLLGSPNFELINHCHRLFLFMNASSNSRQVTYIVNSFFKDTETRDYLKSVIGFVESEQEVLGIEFNPLASQDRRLQVVVAFSHLTSLIDKGYFLLYPFSNWGAKYTSNFKDSVLPSMSDNFPFDENTSFPPSTLVAVPASVVVKAKKAKLEDDGGNSATKCMKQSQWNETIRDIEESIEHYFAPPKWQTVKNLAREILRNSSFCVTQDGKTFHLKDKPKSVVSLIDFLALATRKAGPTEKEKKKEWNIYSLHVDALLKNKAPRDLFKNRLLLPAKYLK